MAFIHFGNFYFQIKICRKSADFRNGFGYNKDRIKLSRKLCIFRWCFMKYISRHMESRILELSRFYSAILLTGPRQAGKTTMLRELAEKENIGRSLRAVYHGYGATARRARSDHPRHHAGAL